MRTHKTILYFKNLLFLINFLILLPACSPANPPLQGYLEGEYINLAANFSGTLKELLVSRGDTVKVGQLLYVLDSEPEASQLAQTKQQLIQAQKTLSDLENGQRETILNAIIAQREQAKASLALSSQTLKRYRILYKQEATDKATLDQAESNYQRDLNQVNEFTANLAEAQQGARENAISAQKAAVEAAQANVIKATWELAQKKMYAPASGHIFDTYYKVGEFVNTQQPVLSLLAPKDIKLIFYITEPKRAEVAVGQTVYFECDNCEKRFQAVINYISPDAEYTPPVIFSQESRGKLVYRIEAKLSTEAAQKFYPGQPVDVFLKK